MRSYVYMSRNKIEDYWNQWRYSGALPSSSLTKFRVSALEVEFANDNLPLEGKVVQVENYLSGMDLIRPLESVGPGEFFTCTAHMKWGHLECDWGDTGPDPTVIFVGSSGGKRVALYGSLAHVLGAESVPGARTGSHGFVLWDLVSKSLDSFEPGLVDRDYPGIRAGSHKLLRWTEEECEVQTAITLDLVEERLTSGTEGHYEFLAFLHRRFDCSDRLGKRKDADWLIGSPLYVARSPRPPEREFDHAESEEKVLQSRNPIHRLLGYLSRQPRG